MKFFHRLFSCYLYVVIVWLSMVFGLLALMAQPWDKRARFAQFMTRVWARAILFASLVRVGVWGEGNFRPDESYVFGSNHASFYDVLVLTGYVKRNFRWFARRDLFDVIVMGRCMWVVGHLPVYRDSPVASLRSLLAAVDLVKAGTSVVIFPEGRRSDDGRLQAFLEGGFVLAIKSGRPVVPVSISGTFKIMSRHNLLIRPGKVRLIFGEPIPTAGLRRRDAGRLMDQVRAQVQTMLETGRA
ncbi:MAG: 1-acyl-sn-glycerol-3-phosphate acyltransferase [Proteobacteria bacterium]|nr:1-acyl-sn-glycerol-3-phosphate acyltransferase [Pseudomonadota bacterium]